MVIRLLPQFLKIRKTNYKKGGGKMNKVDKITLLSVMVLLVASVIITYSFNHLPQVSSKKPQALTIQARK